MKRDLLCNSMMGGEKYVAPAVELCVVSAERGFFVSSNSDLTYGDEGAAGAIGNGNSYEL
jgi:hypothetical protein